MALTSQQAQKVRDLFAARQHAKTPEERALISKAIDEASHGKPSTRYAYPVKKGGKVVGVKTAEGTKTYHEKGKSAVTVEQKEKTTASEEPEIVSHFDIVKERFQTTSGVVRQLSDIDPKSKYRLESGEIVTGKELRYRYAKSATDYLSQPVRPGQYVKKDDTYYRLSPELSYLAAKAEPKERQRLLGSMGQELPEGTMGPVLDPTIAAYKSLTQKEKEEYGYRYIPFIDEPISTWKHYPGGTKYLKSLSKEKKEELATRFLKEHKVEHDPWYVFGSTWRVDKQSVSGFRTKGLKDEEARRKIAWEELTTLPGQLRQDFYDELSPIGSSMYSFGHNLADIMMWPVTLAQTGVKYATGKGDITDPIGRISTGKTFFPDVGKELQSRKIGGPSGIITIGISEGIGVLTGKESQEWETAQKYPLETIFATGGELLGFYLGGQYATNIYKGVKDLSLKGLGKTRSYLITKTGKAIPGYEQISYYYPQRILRRWWIKGGTKDIDKALGIPYHSTETLTPGGLSYAPGKTPTQRIDWVTRKLVDTRDMPITKGNYLIGSSGSKAIGRTYIIKSKTLHELPAFSGAPYGFTPTRFYRFGMPGGGYSSGQVSLLPSIFRPSGFAIRLKQIFKPVTGTYDDIAKWTVKQPKGGWGMIGPKMLKGGPEAEINIFGRTVLKRYLPSESPGLLARLKGYQYYTTVPLKSGLKEVAPIVFTKPIHHGFPRAVAIFSNKVNKALFGGSSLGYSKTASLISPYYPAIVAGRASISSVENKDKSLLSLLSSRTEPISVSKISSDSLITSYSNIPNSYSLNISKSISSSGSSINQLISMPKSISKTSSVSSKIPSYVPSNGSRIGRSHSFDFGSKVGLPVSMLGYEPAGPFKGKTEQQGFNVFVKERYHYKGKKRKTPGWTKLNKSPLVEMDALSVGSSATDNSSAASFKIKETNRKPQPLKLNIARWPSNQPKFYKKGNIFIEKTGFRIDTPGEIKGISALGWIAEQRRKQAPRRKTKKRRSKDPLKEMERLFPDNFWGSMI